MESLKLYSDIRTHRTILEVWGASTKHPDYINVMQEDIDRREFFPLPYPFDRYPEAILQNVIQWILHCASKTTFLFTAKEMIDMIPSFRISDY